MNLPYTPPRSTFINQLAMQEVDMELVAYFMKVEEVAPAPKGGADMLPDPRPVNWRNSMILAQLYPVLKHDDALLNEVAYSILGANSIRDLKRIIAGEIPLAPREILGGNVKELQTNPDLKSPKEAAKEWKAKVEGFKKARRTDLTSVSAHRLVAHLNNADVHLSPEQVDNLGDFIMELPKETALDSLRRLIQTNCPRADYYRPMLTMWKSPNGVDGGPVTDRFINLLHDLRAELASVRAAEEAGQGGLKKV